MMKRNGRQSDNVIDIRDTKENEKYQAKVKQELRARNSPRLLSDESVAYNTDKSPSDLIVNRLKNPGRATKTRATRQHNDPAPESLDQTSRSNYDEVPFFKHKEVPNVYKEEK
jgi:hypothetical protein